MRLASIIVVIVALVLAAAIFFIVPRFMGASQQAQAPGQVQVVQVAGEDVLVAAKNLPAGTVLQSDDVRWQKWPKDAVDDSYLVREKGADPQKLAIGMVALHGIEQGQPITANRLLKPGEGGFLSAVLAPGMRAVTVRVSAETADAGFILPGDRVDVILDEHYAVNVSPAVSQMSVPQVTTKDVSNVILSNVKVLAIDQVMADLDSKPKVANDVTLEVSLKDAQHVLLATQLGTVALVLRSHTIPREPDAAPPLATNPAANMVQDYQVSPFRGALVQLYYSQAAIGTGPQQQAAQAGTMLRVYHGASLSGGGQ